MSGAPTPPFIPEAFATDADPQYINVIPATSVDPQRATWEDGFPPQTMTPIFSGGKPMLGPDMNGVLNALSAWNFALQAGQYAPWSADVAAAMGGYAVGAILERADGTGQWLNLVDANSTDPDAGAFTGWVPVFRYGITTIVSTGGTYTMNANEASRGVIVVTGALVGNLQVVFPTWSATWLIVNATSGAFTTSARTPSGTSRAIPQGGYNAPVELYGANSDLFPTVAPLSIPTSVSAVANTYVLRDPSADVFARYFNSSAAQENATIASLFSEFGSDGYLRKVALVNVAAQMLLSQLAGSVTNGQVPQSAVTQYAAAILANAALTGTPTAPTPAAGDSSTKVATTAFVGGSLSVSGTTINIVLPGGFVLKAGFTQGVGGGPGDVAVTFVTPFPNACRAVVCCTANRNGAGSAGTGYPRSVTASGFTMLVDTQQTGAGAGNKGGYWVAVGN